MGGWISLSRIYKNLDQVYDDVKQQFFSNEHSFRQAFVEAIKEESVKICREDIATNIIIPLLDAVIEGRKPDIIFANVVMELEKPPLQDSPISKEKIESQLKPYMKKLANRLFEAVIWGLATNGWKAELWRLIKIPLDKEYKILIEKETEGIMPEVVRQLLVKICTEKILIIVPDDLIRIFGVK